MSNKQDKNRDFVRIFHFTAQDDYSVVVHPFDNVDDFASVETNGARVFYGAEPDVAYLAAFRNWMYGLVDSFIREWISEKFFISRFLLSALVFIVVYFFLGFVIRDPIPFVDEFVGAVVISVIVFFYFYRRDRDSFPVLERKSLFIKKIDSIKFVPSDFVYAVESVVNGFMGSEFDDFEDFYSRLFDVLNKDKDLLSALSYNLDCMFLEKGLKKAFSAFKRIYRQRDYQALRSFLLSLDKKQAFLVCLYSAIVCGSRESVKSDSA